MSNRTVPMTDALHGYLVEVSVRESDSLRALREVTAELPNRNMQIAPEQGAFMGWLVTSLGARRAIEVGTFTGYSALAVAEALPEDGRVVCCDVSEEFTSIGLPHWERAGVRGKIDLRIGPASETLAAMIDAGEAGTYDFAFIDADKEGYDAYYEACLTLLRPGGVIAIDNVLWGGSVADASNQEPSTRALRAINDKVFADARVRACMVPVGDGLTLATKR